MNEAYTSFMTTLKEHFETYTNERKFVQRLRPATLHISHHAFGHFLRLMPEISQAHEVTHAVVLTFFMRMQTRQRWVGKRADVLGIKDSSILAYASPLKTFFKWLVLHEVIATNPFDGLKLPTPSFVDQRALKGEEIKKILGAILQHATNPLLRKRDTAMVSVLMYCGLRRNEILSLEMRDIDLDDGFITVRSETSKSKRTRRIPMNIYLKYDLKEYLKERKSGRYKTSALFVSNTGDQKLSVHGFKHWVERLNKTSGVKFHLHRFRHTFATNLALQDVGTIKIQKLMGHKDIKMTQTYLRSVSTEEMRDDVNKLSLDKLA